MKMRVLASIGSVAIAAASSACCWLPLVAVGLGLGAGGAAMMLDRYRWIFLVLASVLLAVGFYLNYRRDDPCDPDGSCPPERQRFRVANRAVLWSSAGLVAIFALLPEVTAVISRGARFRPSGPDAATSLPMPVRISTDGHELRDAFNRDAGSVRLVVLLSPT